MSAKLVAIYPVSSATNVSTLTALLAFTDFSGWRRLVFSLQNHDGANTVNLVVETSEDGSIADQDSPDEVTVTAGKQGSIEVGPEMLRKYWRLSAHSASPGFATVSVTWSVAGVGR